MVGARRAARPSLRRSRAFPVTVVLVLIAAATTLLGAAAPAAAALPKGFTVVTALSGLTQPTAVRFAPNGRVFVAEKRGTIQMFDDLADTTPTQVADLRTDVNNVSDRGLLGLAVDPGFPDRPYLYALYTFDGPMGGASPLWGVAGQDNDPCPDAPAATSPGCVVSGKLTRLTLTGDSTTGQDLIHDWCQQYVTHTVGDVVFGADGALYVSGGDGASWGAWTTGRVASRRTPAGIHRAKRAPSRPHRPLKGAHSGLRTCGPGRTRCRWTARSSASRRTPAWPSAATRAPTRRMRTRSGSWPTGCATPSA